VGPLERLTSLLAPHRCVMCGAAGTLLCAWCAPDAFMAVPSRCFHCQAATADSAVCKKCHRQFRLRHAWIAAEYEGAAQQLIRCLKFERAPAAAAPIARSLAETLPYFDEHVIFTHIPAATSRVRQRGYDQSQLIARELARITRRRHATLLRRHGQARQVGAKRSLRLQQLEGVFSPLRLNLVKGAQIVLIDDVVTTGATLGEAAKTLRQAGAKSVDAAIFAQKM